MLNEHERIVLLQAIPKEGLEEGDVGSIVHIYKDGQAYEVEFIALDGHTRAVVTVEAEDIRPVSRHDMTHARFLAKI